METSLKFLSELDSEVLKAELLAFLVEDDIEINDMSDFIFEFEEYIKDDFTYGDC